MQTRLAQKQTDVAVLCRRFGVSRLEVFGSAAVRLARESSAGFSFAAYEANALVRSAGERQLEILGEPCQRMTQVDSDIRRRLPEIGFAIGLRNKIIHGCDHVENAVVYDTLMQDLPVLGQRLAEELAKLPAP